MFVILYSSLFFLLLSLVIFIFIIFMRLLFVYIFYLVSQFSSVDFFVFAICVKFSFRLRITFPFALHSFSLCSFLNEFFSALFHIVSFEFHYNIYSHYNVFNFYLYLLQTAAVRCRMWILFFFFCDITTAMPFLLWELFSDSH